MRSLVVFGLAGYLLFAGAVSASDENVGLMAANGCVNCHGLKGRGSDLGNIPPLMGRSKEYLVSALDGYRSGSLSGTIMNRVMKGVDGNKVDVLASYFSSY